MILRNLREAHRVCYGSVIARRSELYAGCFRHWRKIHCFHLTRVWTMRSSGSSTSLSTRASYRTVRFASLLLSRFLSVFTGLPTIHATFTRQQRDINDFDRLTPSIKIHPCHSYHLCIIIGI